MISNVSYEVLCLTQKVINCNCPSISALFQSFHWTQKIINCFICLVVCQDKNICQTLFPFSWNYLHNFLKFVSLVYFIQKYVPESEQKQRGNATKWAGPGIAQKRSYSVVANNDGKKVSIWTSAKKLIKKPLLPLARWKRLVDEKTPQWVQNFCEVAV